MGTSTVSGPFRSANGFQQLDENGVWVPVTGGGGGNPSVLTVEMPNDGSQNNLFVPIPAQIGQTYIISSTLSSGPGGFGNGVTGLFFQPFDSNSSVVLQGAYFNFDASTVDQFFDDSMVPGSSVAYNFTNYPWLMQVTYSGFLVYDGLRYDRYLAQYWQYGG